MIIHTQTSIDALLKSKNIVRLEPYINIETPIFVKCLLDEYVWKLHVCNLLYHNNGCPRCSGNERWTNEKIDEYLIKNNKTIKRIGNYKNNKTKIEWECLVHGNIFSMSFQKIKIKQGCSICSNIMTWTNEK